MTLAVMNAKTAVNAAYQILKILSSESCKGIRNRNLDRGGSCVLCCLFADLRSDVITAVLNLGSLCPFV